MVFSHFLDFTFFYTNILVRRQQKQEEYFVYNFKVLSVLLYPVLDSIREILNKQKLDFELMKALDSLVYVQLVLDKNTKKLKLRMENLLLKQVEYIEDIFLAKIQEIFKHLGNFQVASNFSLVLEDNVTYLMEILQFPNIWQKEALR